MREKVTYKEGERAILIAVVPNGVPLLEVNENLNELEFLAQTAGAITIKQFTQKLPSPDIRTYIGSGKVEEIKAFVEEDEVDIIIIDDDLSTSQLRNLEKIFKQKVIDRTNLILDIFARRAQTAHARKQVELAQYQYLLPRLTNMWTHLERQKGGIGLRGPGETEIETDRRIIRDRITKLKRDLAKIDLQKSSQRKNRGRMIRVALVGYTNAGKSTLMNLLSKSNIMAENKLFATLDTTVRKVIIDNLPFLLSDTVGFIRKLPHQLVESFKSTLDETRESDLLIHMVDASHKNFEEQVKVVEDTLSELGVSDIPRLFVFNKVDAFSYHPKDEDDLTPKELKNLTLEERIKNLEVEDLDNNLVIISAKNKTNLEELKKIMYERIIALHVKRFPYNDFLY